MKKLSILVFISFMFILGGCFNSFNLKNMFGGAVVKTGDVIKVNYIGTLDDGTVFDTSVESVAKDNGLYNAQRPYEPLSFTVGAGQMIKGFDMGVIGMKKGETKNLRIEAKDAYGESNPAYITGIKLDIFKSANIEPKIGQSYPFGGGQNGKVLGISGDIVTIDFNHPFAGKTLNFEVTIVEIGK